MRSKNIYHDIFCLLLLFTLAGFLSFPLKLLAKDDLNCSLCHIFKELKIIDSDGKEKSFYVNKDLFNSLTHKKLTCETCHYTIIQTPHPPEQIKRINCQTKCHLNDASIDKNFTHEPQNVVFRKSAHGDRVENPIGCACHNKHLMGKVKEFSPLEINRMCANNCHEDKLLMYKYKVPSSTVSSYLDSYHGEIIKFDDKNYPSCYTCHSNHDIKIKEEKESPVNAKNRLKKVCARKDCHQTGFEKQTFVQGTYHQIYKKADKRKEWFLENLKKTYEYLIVFTVFISFLYYTLRFISKIRRKKIWISLLVISIILIIVVGPYILGLFIKGRGVRFAFSSTPDRYKSICLECHNLYPHQKNIVMRAFMNLHSLKLACEVCHVRSLSEIELVEAEDKRLSILSRKKELKEKILEEEEKPLVIDIAKRGIVYKWYKNGLPISSLIRKMDGDDGSQIMIFRIMDNNKLSILEAKKDSGLPQGFKVSPKAVQCKDCHDKKGLMDFRKLGYGEKMVVERLERTRAFEMLHKSEKFLIPKLF
ncbi:hypothetical protein HY745_07345 [Candidatus Desantisbacteria bacterium]|nr:hypothetical protein [Candidatus Desantisbacteria bacterium]